MFLVLLGLSCLANGQAPTIESDGTKIVVKAEDFIVKFSDGTEVPASALRDLLETVQSLQAEIAELKNTVTGVEGDVENITSTLDAAGNIIPDPAFEALDAEHWQTTPSPIVTEDGKRAHKCQSIADNTATHGPNYAVSTPMAMEDGMAYEFSIMLKSDEPGMRNYFGLWFYDENKNAITTEGSAWQNPWFKISKADKNSWTRISAYTLPSSLYPDVKDDSPLGVGSLAGSGTGGIIHFITPPSAKYVAVRWTTGGGDGDGKGVTFFATPSVFAVESHLLPMIVGLTSNKGNGGGNNGNLVTNSDFSDDNNRGGWERPVMSENVVQVEWLDGLMVAAHESAELEHDEGALVVYHDSWGISNLIAVSPKDNFEFSIWSKCADTDKIKNYLGFFAYDIHQKQIKGDGVEAHLWNPYFYVSSQTSSSHGRWKRWSARLVATREGYDANNARLQGGWTSGIDYVMPKNTAYIRLRYGSAYGDGSGTGKIYYAKPSVTLIDTGTTPVWAEDELLQKVSGGNGNLVKGSDFSAENLNRAEWKNSNFEITRVPWIDGRMVNAATEQETEHAVGEKKCYSAASGQAASNVIAIDNLQSYQVGLWIKSNNTDVNNYFGFHLYTKYMEQIRGDFLNPYFKTSQGESSSWTLHTGVLLSSDTPSTDARGRPLADNDMTTSRYDYILPKDAAYITLRWLTCYGDGDGTGKTHFAFPSLKKVAGAITDDRGPSGSVFKITYLGRFDVGVDSKFKTSQQLGDSNRDPSPWYLLSEKEGLFFSFYESYSGYYNLDSHELMTRFCMSYTDTLSNMKGGKGVKVRLRRGDTADQAASGLERILNPNEYPAKHVFWEHTFPQTWSSNGLVHHRCGDWVPAAAISCGFAWSNTCLMELSVDKGGFDVTVQSMNMEIGIRAIH